MHSWWMGVLSIVVFLSKNRTVGVRPTHMTTFGGGEAYFLPPGAENPSYAIGAERRYRAPAEHLKIDFIMRTSGRAGGARCRSAANRRTAISLFVRSSFFFHFVPTEPPHIILSAGAYLPDVWPWTVPRTPTGVACSIFSAIVPTFPSLSSILRGRRSKCVKIIVRDPRRRCRPGALFTKYLTIFHKIVLSSSSDRVMIVTCDALRFLLGIS